MEAIQLERLDSLLRQLSEIMMSGAVVPPGIIAPLMMIRRPSPPYSDEYFSAPSAMVKKMRGEKPGKKRRRVRAQVMIGSMPPYEAAPKAPAFTPLVRR